MTGRLKNLRTTLGRFYNSTPGGGSNAPVAATAFLREAARDPALERVMQGYAWFVPLSLWSNPIKGARGLVMRKQRFSHPTQRPLIYFPHLASQPWWPPDDIAAALATGFEAFQSEFRAAEQRIREHPLNRATRSGAWRSIMLHRDNLRIEDNCALFPRTLDIVERLPLCTSAAGQVYFSVMTPGTYLPVHCGITNTRVRYHIGIETHPDATITVGGETRPWETGRCLTFDDSFEHDVRNDGPYRRVVLIVDCWHPDLTVHERAFVTELMRQLDFPGVLRRRN
jgi:aspartate beta-hydroxylase